MKKIKLDQLKVQSFVTNVEDKSQQTIRGGSVGCNSDIPHHCPPSYRASCPCSDWPCDY